jgi:hypothetical protein
MYSVQSVQCSSVYTVYSVYSMYSVQSVQSVHSVRLRTVCALMRWCRTNCEREGVSEEEEETTTLAYCVVSCRVVMCDKEKSRKNEKKMNSPSKSVFFQLNTGHKETSLQKTYCSCIVCACVCVSRVRVCACCVRVFAGLRVLLSAVAGESTTSPRYHFFPVSITFSGLFLLPSFLPSLFLSSFLLYDDNDDVLDGDDYLYDR